MHVVQSAAAVRLAARHAAAAIRTPNEIDAEPTKEVAAELENEGGSETEPESIFGSPCPSPVPSYHDAEEYQDDADGLAEKLPRNDVTKEVPRNDVTKVHRRLRSR